MSRGEDYVPIVCRLIARTRHAAQISVGERNARIAWIPRKLIHGGDEIGLDARSIGIRFTLRVMRWKTDELGLTPAAPGPDASGSGERNLFASAEKDAAPENIPREQLPDPPLGKERARMTTAYTESRDFNAASKDCQAALDNISSGRMVFTADGRLILTKHGFDILQSAEDASWRR
jgi:hypothetical protein